MGNWPAWLWCRNCSRQNQALNNAGSIQKGAAAVFFGVEFAGLKSEDGTGKKALLALNGSKKGAISTIC